MSDVETFLVANPWKPWVFVRLETDAGDEPGFGIELDEDVVAEHAYTEEKVHTINLFETDWEQRELDRR